MLTSTVKVLECREHEKYAIDNVWGFRFSYFSNSHMHKIIMPEVHFHAESTGTRPGQMACKMAKLFKFLQGPTQHKRTRDNFSVNI